MSNTLISTTNFRRTALIFVLAGLSACATSNYSNNADDLYSNIYKSPPTSTLNQNLSVFSNGDLL